MFEAFNDKHILWKSNSSNIDICLLAASIIFSGVGLEISLGKEPPFTPMRIGILFSLHKLTISTILSLLDILPGFNLILSTPWLIAIIASSGSKWISATKGIFIFSFILEIL